MPALNSRLYFYPESFFLKMNISGTKTEGRCSQIKGGNPSIIRAWERASVKVGAAPREAQAWRWQKRVHKGEAINHMLGDINR